MNNNNGLEPLKITEMDMCDCSSKVDGYSSLEDCLRTCRNFYLVRGMLVPSDLNWVGPGWEKPYPNATGTFLDKEGHIWQVRKITLSKEVIYMRWDIDGQDPGASFSDEDGTYTPNLPNPIVGMMD